MNDGFEFADDFDEQLHQLVEHHLVLPLAESVAVDARRLAPVDTHALVDSIEVVPVAWDTALVGSDLDYAAAVELGSGPHIITAKTKKVLANVETGQVFGRTVRHPGTRAQPYLRPALYRNRGGSL